MKNSFRKKSEIFFQIINNIFFPERLNCIICGKDIYEDKYSICLECIEKINFIKGKICLRCGRKLADSYIENICPECERTNYFFQKGISCTEYDDITRKLIIDFKYYNNRYIGRYIGEIMADYLKASYINDIDFIIPVPISKNKENLKGYNHSAVIGKYLSELSGKVFIPDYLIRIKNTRPLKELSKIEREAELKNVFKINKKYDGKFFGDKVLLIDDIYTTGMTLNECSRILRENGYNNIIVMTFSIGNL